ncbi:MAG: cyclic nucleotide-binding domain-containing protein [Myxococcaceae bacterium]|nr:cyclic nucleotide-binding domain-containing protein [Myxococcaceae bacterium]
MSGSSLRELGMDLAAENQWEKALGVFAEAVRRQPADHRSRMLAARAFEKLSEPERAVTTLHACAEGLLRRDYLLSAIAACKQALTLSPNEKRLKETLHRIHARAAKTVAGKASVPPPLPPQELFDGKVQEDLMSLQGAALSDAAINVLAAPDTGGTADSEARPPLPLFADLERDAFVELVSCMAYREVPPGEVISGEGQGGDTIFVIVAGKSEVTRQIDGQPKTLAFLGGGSIFGELAMLTGAPLTATVTTVSETDLFEIRRLDLNQIARSHPSVPQTLTAFAQNRMAKNLMATSPLFQQVPEADRARVLTRFLFKAVQANEKALTEGEHPSGLFLVLAGELVVQKEDPAGGMVSLGILREGDIAGEISLLTGLRATATVLATRKTAAAFLERNAFHELVKEFPQVKTYLEGLSERRLKMIGEALRPAEILDADELVVEGQG